jgi:hypothetical protein
MSLSRLTSMMMGELLASDLDSTQTQVALHCCHGRLLGFAAAFLKGLQMIYLFFKLLRYLILFASRLLLLMVN